MAEGQNSRRSSIGVFLKVFALATLMTVFLVSACRPARSVQTVPESEVPNVRSADLKRTSVVATLDDPLPEHRNVIWCATFQMAWDKLKHDVIKEPIKVIGAEALAERLNQGEFPPTNIENESLYVAAGFVDKGIIEEVQKEMAKRFPSETIPAFDPRYKTLPKAFLGYGFLGVGVPFKYPFYASKGPLEFTNSNGASTSVRSFDTAPTAPYPDSAKVREQVEVLFGGSFNPRDRSKGFALDLCKYSQPYQIVLACVPREDTLAATIGSVEKRIAEPKRCG